MQTIQNISLATLRPGHERPGATINARTVGRAADIEQLAASIKEEGLLQSLLVVEGEKKGTYYVADGNRRLAALQLLAKKKTIADEALIPALVSSESDPVKALRKSLAAGAQHIVLHPVDQFETFVACEGESPEKIAERYALPVRVVKQRLALGKLSPVIRKAWREGKLTADAAESYASNPHHGAQEKLFKSGGWAAKDPREIRSRLIGNTNAIDKLLKFVGEDAYKAAGGKLIEDLFGEKEGRKIADFGLLQKCAHDKLKAKAAEYVAKGWGWAMPEDDAGSSSHMWPMRSNPTPDEKKKLGVLLDISHTGALETKTGVIKPGTTGIKPSNGRAVPKAAPKKKDADQISDSLMQRLSETLSFGTSAAMAHDKPELALSLALAAMAAQDGPISLSENGLAEMKRDKYGRGNKVAKFADQLPVFLKLPLKDKMVALAGVVGRAIDMQSQSSSRPPLGDQNIVAVIARMEGKRLNAEIRAKFDAEDYFNSVSSALRLAAVREMNPQHEPLVVKMKKGEQVKAALGCYTLSKNWLPPQLRTVHYEGPALKKAAAKKKPAKKKGGR